MAVLDDLEPVTGSIGYIIRDPKHDSEKPYYVYCDYEHDFPRTNTKFENKAVTIYNARNLNIPAKEMFSEMGFARLSFKCPLKPDECYERERVIDTLFPAYADLLRTVYPEAVRVELLEHGIRQRDAEYPKDERERYTFPTNQPSNYAHIDMTPLSAQKNAVKVFDIHPEQYKRYVAVTLWKPIRGPVYDWPLTVCDRRTIDTEKHTTEMDIISETFINENMPINYSEVHKWYYWDALTEDEVIAFVQADSAATGQAGVPHTAFKDSRVGPDVPLRESIEARVFVYFD